MAATEVPIPRASTSSVAMILDFMRSSAVSKMLVTRWCGASTVGEAGRLSTAPALLGFTRPGRAGPCFVEASDAGALSRILTTLVRGGLLQPAAGPANHRERDGLLSWQDNGTAPEVPCAALN